MAFEELFGIQVSLHGGLADLLEELALRDG
jgi:hypothetical protein